MVVEHLVTWGQFIQLPSVLNIEFWEAFYSGQRTRHPHDEVLQQKELATEQHDFTNLNSLVPPHRRRYLIVRSLIESAA
jgi:hypothetical protein